MKNYLVNNTQYIPRLNYEHTLVYIEHSNIRKEKYEFYWWITGDY